MTEHVVTGHQVNTLPGVSVLSKFAVAETVILMDEMQYVRHGWVNRNRLSDGTWLTIPVAESDTLAPINRVRIADPGGRAREKMARTIEHRLGVDDAAPYATPLRKPFVGLAALNVALLENLMWDLDRRGVFQFCDHWTLFQSHLAAGRYDDVSEGLAAMVAEVGGTVWLSGPSGRNYLDESPFYARGIEVRYFAHEGPNPCALELLLPTARLAA